MDRLDTWLNAQRGWRRFIFWPLALSIPGALLPANFVMHITLLTRLPT
jgi:hypothetical protein